MALTVALASTLQPVSDSQPGSAGQLVFFLGVCCVGVSRHARVPQMIPIGSNRVMEHEKVSWNKIWGQKSSVLALFYSLQVNIEIQ